MQNHIKSSGNVINSQIAFMSSPCFKIVFLSIFFLLLKTLQFQICPIFQVDKYILFRSSYYTSSNKRTRERERARTKRAKEHLYANYYAFFFFFFFLFKFCCSFLSFIFILRRWKCVFYFYIYFVHLRFYIHFCVSMLLEKKRLWTNTHMYENVEEGTFITHFGRA